MSNLCYLCHKESDELSYDFICPDCRDYDEPVVKNSPDSGDMPHFKEIFICGVGGCIDDMPKSISVCRAYGSDYVEMYQHPKRVKELVKENKQLREAVQFALEEELEADRPVEEVVKLYRKALGYE